MRTLELPPRLSLAAADHGGVFAAAHAASAGIDRHELTRLVAAGVLHRIRRGTYVLAPVWAAADEDGRHVLTARAVMLGLSAPCALSHSTSVRVRGLRHHGLVDDDVHVTHDLGTGSGRREAGVTHHRARLPPDHCESSEGLPTTSDVRTALDVARHQPLAAALVVADHVLARGTPKPLLRQALLDSTDHPGSRSAARVVLLADGRSESVGESLARVAFDAVDLAPDELQLSVGTDRGSFRTDFAWTPWRIVGEFDGRIKYGRLLRPGETTQDVLWRERQRELAIERAGWIVVRFTWAEMLDHGLVRARLVEAIGRSRALGWCA